ncbi:MAG: response regulator [Pseudobdellovibrio sp.]
MRNRNEVVILVVDDEDAITDILKENFELEGFSVLVASSGNAAIEVLKKEKVDFVVSDVRMANGDGIFLLKYIKTNCGDIPFIVLLSGYTEVLVEEVIKLGALDLMSKPPNIEKIIEIINSYCECT